MVEWDFSKGNSIVLSTTGGIFEVGFQEDYKELNGKEVGEVSGKRKRCLLKRSNKSNVLGLYL